MGAHPFSPRGPVTVTTQEPGIVPAGIVEAEKLRVIFTTASTLRPVFPEYLSPLRFTLEPSPPTSTLDTLADYLGIIRVIRVLGVWGGIYITLSPQAHSTLITLVGISPIYPEWPARFHRLPTRSVDSKGSQTVHF